MSTTLPTTVAAGKDCVVLAGLRADNRPMALCSRFYIYNLLAELDEAGEYFVDRARGVLYWKPPAPTAATAGAAGGGVVSLLPRVLAIENALRSGAVGSGQDPAVQVQANMTTYPALQNPEFLNHHAHA